MMRISGDRQFGNLFKPGQKWSGCFIATLVFQRMLKKSGARHVRKRIRMSASACPPLRGLYGPPYGRVAIPYYPKVRILVTCTKPKHYVRNT